MLAFNSIIILLVFSILILNAVEGNNVKRVRQRQRARPRQNDIPSTFRNCPSGTGGENCTLACGNVYVENAKIVGGSEATPHSSPSTVYVFPKYRYVDDPFRTYETQCGGTLIDERTILTAAHCVQEIMNLKKSPDDNDILIKLDSVYVFLGAHNINLLNDKRPVPQPTIRMKVNKTIIHENYDTKSLQNDIALLKLRRSVRLNDYIQIACLPTSNLKLSLNRPAYAFGWGRTDPKFENSASDALRTVSLTIYNDSYCNRVSPENPKNFDTQICAGDYSGRKDTCQGDSGGPLFVRSIINDEIRYLLVGLTSYGDECAARRKPGVYTRVSAFIDWINKNV